MSVLVVGSVALDTVETPHGKKEEALGGSAVYFSVSCANFAPVSLVAVVGKDFPAGYRAILEEKGVDLAGLQVVEGETFRWGGAYSRDMNEAVTRFTCLNVFQDFHPVLPALYAGSDFVFLANIAPELQLEVLSQVRRPRLRVGDTMNLWIECKRDKVIEVASRLDVFILNDAEARMLTGETNLLRAAGEILEMGPKVVVIKKGEHGAILVSRNDIFSLPGLPLEKVIDPTGAGDSFAGGFVGSLARRRRITARALREALVYGSVMASFNVEDFSLNRLRRVGSDDIRARYAQFTKLVRF
jgi:sugar/nucleoside kinase (ribokinase family)